MNHVIKCFEFFLLHAYSKVFINFVYIHRLHQLKHKFKSIIYNISGYEASFLIVSKQIYSQSLENYWCGAGASHFKDAGAELELELELKPLVFKMLERSWSWSHRFFCQLCSPGCKIRAGNLKSFKSKKAGI